MRTWLTVSAALVMAGSLQVAVSAAAENDREFYTGEALYQRCAAAPADPDYTTRHVACRAYVMGVSDALQAAQGVAGAGGTRFHGWSAAPARGGRGAPLLAPPLRAAAD